jgi:hypothetical protein
MSVISLAFNSLFIHAAAAVVRRDVSDAAAASPLAILLLAA